MQPRVPSGITNQDLYNKSLGLVLSGNVSPGNGLTFDSIGQPLTYSTDNMTGVVIRVGSTANPNGLANHWTAANTNLTIPHGLNKVPYGYILIASFAAATIFFGTIPADINNITLQTTNANTDTTIWILV